MTRLRKKLVEYYMFYCPGCNHEHTYTVVADGSQWKFNGDVDNPSFTPSLLNRDIDRDGNTKSICHLFVKNGMIEFCGDCTHDLKGKTIELPELKST